MDLLDFVIEAKKGTYAAVGEGGERVSQDGAKKLSHSSGPFSYRDVYYGSKDFVGEESVSQDGRVVWLMNYSGRTLDDSNAPALYAFLKSCLLLVPRGAPYRGPAKHGADGFVYSNKWDGDLDFFSGREEIRQNGKLVYELNYHGGRIR